MLQEKGNRKQNNATKCLSYSYVIVIVNKYLEDENVTEDSVFTLSVRKL